VEKRITDPEKNWSKIMKLSVLSAILGSALIVSCGLQTESNLSESSNGPTFKGFEKAGENIKINMTLASGFLAPVNPVSVTDDDGLATLTLTHYLLMHKQNIALWRSDNSQSDWEKLKDQPVKDWAYAKSIYAHSAQRIISTFKANPDEAYQTAASKLEAATNDMLSKSAPTYQDLNGLAGWLKEYGKFFSYEVTHTERFSNEIRTQKLDLFENNVNNPLGTMLISMNLDLPVKYMSKSGAAEFSIDWKSVARSYEKAAAAGDSIATGSAVRCENTLTSRGLGPYTMMFSCDGGKKGFAHNNTIATKVDAVVTLKDGTKKDLTIEAPTSSVRDFYVIYNASRYKDVVSALIAAGIAIDQVEKLSGRKYFLPKGTKLFDDYNGRQLAATL